MATSCALGVFRLRLSEVRAETVSVCRSIGIGSSMHAHEECAASEGVVMLFGWKRGAYWKKGHRG